jgi:hypothetical protein
VRSARSAAKPAGDDHVPSARQRERERIRRRATRNSALIAAASTVVLGTVIWLVVTRSPGWPRVRESFFNWDYAKSSFPSVLAGLWLNVRVMVLRYVVLPQAVRQVVPPLLNDLVSLQKDSGLISILGAIDAVRAAGIATATSFNFTPFVVAGALFVLLTIPITRLTDWLGRRVERRRGLGGTV